MKTSKPDIQTSGAINLKENVSLGKKRFILKLKMINLCVYFPVQISFGLAIVIVFLAGAGSQ